MELLEHKIDSLSELLNLDLDSYGIKGLIFDYGGTIDTHGEHWSDVIFQGYKEAGVTIPYEIFWDAYVYAERELARLPYILPNDTFFDLLSKKIDLQLKQLAKDHHLPSITEKPVNALSIVNYLYTFARSCALEAKPILEELSRKYPMVIVSNFYGNLNAVLEDFGIRHCFKTIIESAVVGVRKPNPEIFRLGIKALNLAPQHVVTIGDSLKKDILPARSLGTHTIQLLPR